MTVCKVAHCGLVIMRASQLMHIAKIEIIVPGESSTYCYPNIQKQYLFVSVYLKKLQFTSFFLVYRFIN